MRTKTPVKLQRDSRRQHQSAPAMKLGRVATAEATVISGPSNAAGASRRRRAGPRARPRRRASPDIAGSRPARIALNVSATESPSLARVRALIACVAKRRLGGDDVGEIRARPHQRAERRDAIDEAQAKRLLGVDAPAGQQQLHRDGARQRGAAGAARRRRWRRCRAPPRGARIRRLRRRRSDRRRAPIRSRRR